MGNDILKHTLKAAGLTAEEFAEIVQVDPKTVQRWVAGRIPRPRHRTTIARALDRPEHELWPDTIPAPDAEESRPSIGEVIGSWGRATDPGAPNPAAFIKSAGDTVDLLDDNLILNQPPVHDAIRDRAFEGCDIRILTSTPPGPALTGQDQIAIRTADTRLGHVIVRADDRILFALALAGDRYPVLLELDRRTDDGLFYRLAHHFHTLWNTYNPSPEDDAEAADPEPAEAPATQAPPTGPATKPHQPPAPEEPAPRRWPRRLS